MKAKAVNLPTAIARFADSAATSALVPPSVLMLWIGPSGRAAAGGRGSASDRTQYLDGRPAPAAGRRTDTRTGGQRARPR
ncbi:hypothetical protein GCM10025734_35270 [Kitasatospora paranensis]